MAIQFPVTVLMSVAGVCYEPLRFNQRCSLTPLRGSRPWIMGYFTRGSPAPVWVGHFGGYPAGVSPQLVYQIWPDLNPGDPLPDSGRTGSVGHQIPHPGVVEVKIPLGQPFRGFGDPFMFKLINHGVARIPADRVPAPPADAVGDLFVVGNVYATVTIVPLLRVFWSDVHAADLKRGSHVSRGYTRT